MNNLSNAFPGQQPNERVFIFARPYPIAFIPTALIFLLVFSLSFIGQILLARGNIAASTISINSGIVLLGIFQLFVLIVFFIALFDFYFDIIIVTNRRLVDIDQEQLFFRRIAELGLEDVEDVSSQQKGFLQTVFNYGDVEAQTAGTRPNFLFKDVYFPREVAAIILNLAEQAKDSVAAERRFPVTPTVGVINNASLRSAQELQTVGAIPPNGPE